MNFDPMELMGQDPYGLAAAEKADRMMQGLKQLTEFHRAACTPYDRIMEGLEVKTEQDTCLGSFKPLPVRIFKELDLKSVGDGDVAKTMTSSGTSGQRVSKIHLSSDNTRLQTKVLANIIQSFIGKQRLPLLILDSEAIRRDRKMYSARGAGTVGFSTFGRPVMYALDGDMNLKFDEVRTFLKDNADSKILMFGYTYMIWQYIIRVLEDLGESLNIRDGIMFHTGGWKKVQDQAVSAAEYIARAKQVFGNVAVHNYYGMAEQLGSIFVECEQGHMHCSVFSDVLVRRFEDLSVASFHERGFLELISLLPISYPGHVLLTEDEGEVLGEDDCPCGRLGRYFKIHGRVKGAEIRGCSDTFER